jgi:hypothetical protein
MADIGGPGSKSRGNARARTYPGWLPRRARRARSGTHRAERRAAEAAGLLRPPPPRNARSACSSVQPGASASAFSLPVIPENVASTSAPQGAWSVARPEWDEQQVAQGSEDHASGRDEPPGRWIGADAAEAACTARSIDRSKGWMDGADGETRNRTGDTTIFSRVLYQLSYLAAAGAMLAPWLRAFGSDTGRAFASFGETTVRWTRPPDSPRICSMC